MLELTVMLAEFSLKMKFGGNFSEIETLIV